ncbi:MAG: peptide ABC transporter substrate-binding protein [Clostridia bacterium]|nr:peptide ABC transporter substrate-binding protein [Clostridia bacterium]
MKKTVCVILIFVLLLCTACSSDTIISMSFAVKEAAGSFDPQIAENATTNILVKNCFEGLVRYNENGEIVPGVASGWTVSKDGLTYTFTLRENAVWHLTNTAKKQLEGKLPEDFSLEVTAYDFEFALKRAVDPSMGAKNAYLLKNIANASAIIAGNASPDTLAVKAADKYTLKITLSQPQSNFLNVLTESICMPCNETFFEACGGRYGMFIKYFISNGPFYISYFDEKSYRLTKSTDYTGDNFAAADTLWFYIQSDTDALVSVLEEHQYSGAYLSELEFGKLKTDRKMTVLEIKDVTRCFVLNTENEFLSDINIRLAFISVVDAVSLAEKNSKQVSGLLPASFGGEASAGEYYKPDKAVDYLKKGLEKLNREDISVSVLTPVQYEESLKIAMQKWQQTLGVNMIISVEAVNETELIERVKKGEYDIAFYPLRAQTPCKEDFYHMFTSLSDNNIIKLEDEAYDKLVNSLYSSSQQNRDKLFSQAEKKLLNTGAVIPVWSESTYFVCTQDARGVIALPGEENLYLFNATDE